MLDDRRSANRTRLSGLRATFESANGLSQEADVFNLSRAGLFLETETQIPVGKRLSLEVYATGEPAPWPALGRVVWTRSSQEGSERPRGMGVKLIDVEDAVVDAIDRLVDLREHTAPGIGHELARANDSEETIVDVMTAPVTETPAARPSEPFVTPLVTPLRPPRLADASNVSRHADEDDENDESENDDENENDPVIEQRLRPEKPAPSFPVGPQSDSPSARTRLRLPPAAHPPLRIMTRRAMPVTAPDFAFPTAPRRRGWIVVGLLAVAVAIAAYALHGFLQGPS